MALKLAQQTSAGVAVEYHRILSIAVDYDTGRADVTIGSYLTQAARAAGKAPVARTRLPVAIPAAGLAGDPRVEIYKYLAQPAPAPVAGVDASGKATMKLRAPVVTGFLGAESV